VILIDLTTQIALTDKNFLSSKFHRKDSGILFFGINLIGKYSKN